MGLFSTMLNKLGFGDKEAEAASVAAAAPAAAAPAAAAGAAEPAGFAPMAEVDVVAKLEWMASENAEKLNWKTSIVDLMKLVGMDSSFAARKELAAELGCPQEKMGDSAQMNIWLHKTVMQKIAASGGNVPAELL